MYIYVYIYIILYIQRGKIWGQDSVRTYILVKSLGPLSASTIASSLDKGTNLGTASAVLHFGQAFGREIRDKNPVRLKK